MTDPNESVDKPNILKYSDLLATLDGLLNQLTTTQLEPSALKGKNKTTLIEKIQRTIQELQELLYSFDKVKIPDFVLDPSEPHMMAQLIANTLRLQKRLPLATVPQFYGSGIYAIYYRGEFDAYQPISNTNTPIYVGKADPATHNARTPQEQGTRLSGRLSDHRKNIDFAENLDINDFDCRYLVIKSAWQGMAETYLINHFRPVWNKETNICFGFGKHGDDANTRANKKSPWDTLHPGRKWATNNVPYDYTADEIKGLIAEHFRHHPPEP